MKYRGGRLMRLLVNWKGDGVSNYSDIRKMLIVLTSNSISEARDIILLGDLGEILGEIHHLYTYKEDTEILHMAGIVKSVLNGNYTTKNWKYMLEGPVTEKIFGNPYVILLSDAWELSETVTKLLITEKTESGGSFTLNYILADNEFTINGNDNIILFTRNELLQSLPVAELVIGDIVSYVTIAYKQACKVLGVKTTNDVCEIWLLNNYVFICFKPGLSTEVLKRVRWRILNNFKKYYPSLEYRIGEYTNDWTNAAIKCSNSGKYLQSTNFPSLKSKFESPLDKLYITSHKMSSFS